MDFTELFSTYSPCILGFISKLTAGPSKPHFPTIFGTGFFVHSSGIVCTNRHVIEAFSQLRPHPKTGDSPLAAVAFFPSDDAASWQMLILDPVGWIALSEFSSSDEWFGQTVPDLGFVQMSVRDVPALKVGNRRFLSENRNACRNDRVSPGNSATDRFGQIEPGKSFHKAWHRQQCIPVPSSKAARLLHGHHATRWFQWITSIAVGRHGRRDDEQQYSRLERCPVRSGHIELLDEHEHQHLRAGAHYRKGTSGIYAYAYC